MLKCDACKLIFRDIVDACPECGSDVVEMCDLDTGSCDHGVVSGIKICEKCGEFICPECGSHDVQAISRITGYLSPVGNGS